MIAPLRPDDPRAIGPYRLSGRLGCGGMGRVFLGLSADGITAAVKIIRAELAADREFRARFRDEVAAARKVAGPFTALVIDADPDDPMPWLATDYVPGPSLAEAVESRGPLPVSKVLWLAAGLAEGLAAIHAAGLVHRDLKPSNVLLAEDRPRVIDFGISQAAWTTAMSAADFGSPRFMSPEHALGEAIGPPSDMFSLGAVLTFAATGQGPFGSGLPAALIYRLVNSPARLDLVPGQLRGLVASCLAKHPDDRPTVDRVRAQVEAIQRQSGQRQPAQVGEPALKALTQGDPAAGPAGSGNGTDISALAGVSSQAQPFATEPQSGRGGRDVRHRVSRSLPLFVPGLLAASAAAIIMISGVVSPSPAPPAQPQAGTATTAPAGAAPPQGADTAAVPGQAPQATVTRGASAGEDRIGPSIIQSAPASAFLSAAALASGLPGSSPSGAVAPGGSPSASRSSRSASPSPSSGSGSPSPSPSTSSSSPSPAPSSSSPSTPATSTPSTSGSSATSSGLTPRVARAGRPTRAQPPAAAAAQDTERAAVADTAARSADQGLMS